MPAMVAMVWPGRIELHALGDEAKHDDGDEGPERPGQPEGGGQRVVREVEVAGMPGCWMRVEHVGDPA